jgi:HK97 family phage major capsid protein
MTSKELRLQLAALIQRGRDVINEAEKAKRALSAEDSQTIAKVHADAAELQRQIKDLEQQESYEAALKLPVRDGLEGVVGSAVPRDSIYRPAQPDNVQQNQQQVERQRNLAFRAWCSGRPENLSPDHVQALAQSPLRNAGDLLTVRLPSLEGISGPRASRLDQIANVLSVGIDTAGGFLVPAGFVRALEAALLSFGGIREVATLMRTATGEELPYPITNDTGNEGIEAAETATMVAGADATFGSYVLRAYEYTSRFLVVSHVLVRDAAVDVPTLLGRLIGERLARIQNRRCTTGTGAAQPIGIVPASTLTITTASATAIAADELIQLEFAVDAAYRIGAGWMMNDAIQLAISLLKDGNGAYLWQPGLQAGTPNRLRGFPITPNSHMSALMTATQDVILFGQLSKYILREVGTVRVQRLVERFSPDLAFLGMMSFDGGLLDAGTHPVRRMRMHA